MKPASKKYSVGVHVWVAAEDGHFLGLGRVQLLEHIKNTGSITHAAKAMKMSYRQAWQMVEDMNEMANKPLVEKILGGKKGGGATVTKAGEKAIALFYEIEKDIFKLSNKLSMKIKI